MKHVRGVRQMSNGSWRGNLNKRFGRLRRRWKDSTEVYLKRSGMEGRKLDSYASRYGQVADSCEHDHKHSDSTKCVECLD
jgi:hypothetical protein